MNMNQQLDCRIPRDRIDGALLEQMTATEACPGSREVRRTWADQAGVDVHLAMVYSPYQPFDDLYDLEEALNAGTIFRALDYPFLPTPCRQGGEFR